MVFEKYIPGEELNDAGKALAAMMDGVDIGVSYADMMRYRIAGRAAKACHDVYYVAYENEIACARHWNGWGNHPDAIGNWGNFYTDELCRGRGIGGELLRFWYEDFKKMTNPPLCFLCSAGTKALTDLYRRFGFKPAIQGRQWGPLYMPVGNSPETFQEFCEQYYQPSEKLYHKPANIEYRHELDCLLRFAFQNMDIPFGIGDTKKVEEALLYYPERCGMLFSEDGHCVGWSMSGQIQVYPLYKNSIIIS